MSKHKIDPDMFKGLNEMMKNLQKNPFTPQMPVNNMFGLGNMKKYIFILAGLLFMSGFCGMFLSLFEIISQRYE